MDEFRVYVAKMLKQIHIEGILHALSQHVNINPQLITIGAGNSAFRRAVQMAVDRAVREVLEFSF